MLKLFITIGIWSEESMSNAYEEYMKQVTQPMRDELTQAGFTELTTPASMVISSFSMIL